MSEEATSEVWLVSASDLLAAHERLVALAVSTKPWRVSLESEACDVLFIRRICHGQGDNAAVGVTPPDAIPSQ